MDTVKNNVTPAKAGVQSLDSRLRGNDRVAVCLVSGGLDSATALYHAIQEGFVPLALTIDYGQLHKREIESAKRICGHLKLEHEIILISLPWGSSSLVDPQIPIPENRTLENLSTEIPNTYVPARNTIFLSFAASMAEAHKAEAIFIGANALDYSGYPDCRPDFLKGFEQLMKQGTKHGVEGRKLEIKAPLVHLTKAQIIKRALTLGVPLEWTWSCYKGGERSCQVCDSCLIRKKGFEEVGIQDPALNQLRQMNFPFPLHGGRQDGGSSQLFPPPLSSPTRGEGIRK